MHPKVQYKGVSKHRLELPANVLATNNKKENKLGRDIRDSENLGRHVSWAHALSLVL